MRNFSWILPAVIIVACSTNTPQTAMKVTADTTSATPTIAAEDAFGGTITLDRSTSVTVSEVMSNPELHGRPVLISGTIDDVCQNKGCWLVVTDGSQQMRVTFKDYAFFVPKDSHGRRVLIEGVVSEEEISEGAAKHYASESRDADEQKKEIRGAQKVVTMEATAVAIAHES